MQPLPSATPRHLSGTASLVIMKHDSSQDIMACHFYPSTSQLDVNNAQVLWHLAISAVFYRIRRRNLTWDLLKSRRDRRHRHTSLPPVCPFPFVGRKRGIASSFGSGASACRLAIHRLRRYART